MPITARLISALCALAMATPPLAAGPAAAPVVLAITGVTDNRGDYAGGRIPRYNKLEITFSIANTVAANLQWPYDPAPPPGVPAGAGLTVNALFTPDNWATTYTQPAFYDQPFDYQVRRGRDWLYPRGDPVWKVRFAPNRAGTWHYRLSAQDASGLAQGPVVSFTVGASASRGFIRVSPTDPRYFEFSDGTYFPALGYNMNWDHVDWRNPVSANQDNFRAMGANGIQLVRLWLSQWAVFGAAANPWRCILPRCGPDWPEITSAVSYAGRETAIAMSASYNPCMSSGHWLSAPIAVEPDTTYRVRVRVKTENISGPRLAGQPFGFVAKLTADGNSWLQGRDNNCNDPGVGVAVTNYLGNSDWVEAIGTYRTGPSTYFLSAFYLTLTNVNTGRAYVDQIVMEPDLGGGRYGPNVLLKPGANHHQYADQNLSARFDLVVALAEQNGVYLRPVILNWQDPILDSIDASGALTENHSPANFYGRGGALTKVRWLQQTWWRYLQARWGYSTAIHSWELLNEGDPFDARHAALADAFARYMHQFKPNDHLATTSTWSDYPQSFWLACPNCDFTDVHRYIFLDQEPERFNDTALATFYYSRLIQQANQEAGLARPAIRGETGFVEAGDPNYFTRRFDDDIFGTGANAGQGLWLHNFIWGQINAGGLIESYWYENYDGRHIYGQKDQRAHYRAYYAFIKDVPLSNGHYVDAAALTTGGLRAWGQKDLTNGRAHLWIQNPDHQWHTYAPAARSGSVTLAGFSPGRHYLVEWWDTYAGRNVSTEAIAGDGAGNLVLSIHGLTADLAVRIGRYRAASRPVHRAQVAR